ncbi:fibrous sheath-interacting protein 2 [Geothlypis trichas]
MDCLLDLPLGVKICVKPKSKLVFCRGKLGEKLHGLFPSFNLDDPYMHHLNLQYNCLHDPHLQDYHKRKDILRLLKKQGCVTSENKVICTVKEFNEYRQYLTRIKTELEQMLREEISKETTQKSGRFRRGKGALDKGQTHSTAKLGQEHASRAADSQQKPDDTADSLFKAVLEQLTASEAQKLQALVETVVHEVFGRLRIPRDHYVNFLRRAARRIRGIVFGGCVRTEPPLDHHQEIELVAKELIATALEILGDHLENKASEPGRAARQKEQPVDEGATQADTSKEAETDRARLHACLDKLTTQVVKNVRCLLKSMIASQFGGDSSYEYTEILKLPRGKVSNRQMEPAISGSSDEQSKEESTGVKLPALGPQLHAEGTGYAKTMEPEDSAMVKESLVREENPATSGNTLDIRTIANQIVQSLLDQIGQHGPAPTPRQNFQGPVPSPATSQGGEESSAAEDSLPSVDPQFPRQPTPPEGPKPPDQARARRRSVHIKFT